MSRKGGGGRSRGRGALELIEEATLLLCRAPAEAMALYYLGTLPFIISLLYFWADMSSSADAAGHLPLASLGLALLFVWMKYWQSRFCGELSLLLLKDHSPPALTAVVVNQTIFHSLSLIVLPVALLLTLPFGWCVAFFQNVTVIGGGDGIRKVYEGARRQAVLWQGQNHLLILIFFLLGIVVFANLAVLAYFLPRVMKTLFGVESIFTRSNLFLLNSTFWAAVAALTHICVDPLIKACYLLRCHYGESLSTGADLLADLREARLRAAARITALALAGMVFAVTLTTVNAGEIPAVSAPTPVVNARDLDKSIEKVINDPEFAWRLPRSDQGKAELPGFIRSVVDLVKDWAASVGRQIERFFKWLAKIIPRMKPVESRGSSGLNFRDYVFPIIFGLLAISVSMGAVLIWRQRRNRQGREPEAATIPVTTQPDLSDENVMADELSEESWSILARELLSKGELRLGMRALYLACLAILARERLIAIARYKSNRDYQRELLRFNHTFPEVTTSFASNVAMFEEAWYGRHLPEASTVEAFMANYERIVSGVRQG